MRIGRLVDLGYAGLVHQLGVTQRFFPQVCLGWVGGAAGRRAQNVGTAVCFQRLCQPCSYTCTTCMLCVGGAGVWQAGPRRFPRGRAAVSGVAAGALSAAGGPVVRGGGDGGDFPQQQVGRSCGGEGGADEPWCHLLEGARLGPAPRKAFRAAAGCRHAAEEGQGELGRSLRAANTPSCPPHRASSAPLSCPGRSLLQTATAAMRTKCTRHRSARPARAGCAAVAALQGR